MVPTRTTIIRPPNPITNGIKNAMRRYIFFPSIPLIGWSKFDTPGFEEYNPEIKKDAIIDTTIRTMISKRK